MKDLGKFIFGVKKEMGIVRWPTKKEMITYSTATVAFIIVFAIFFSSVDLILAGIKTVVK
ncbi:MAG: preprotein translocase subunit SecE [Bacilli bacterium]